MFGRKNVAEGGCPQGETGPDSGTGRTNGFENERRLVVGKGISFSGDISSCDVLVVSGKVDASLVGGKFIEITENGQFRGRIDVDRAEIAGRFEGHLTVHGRLMIHPTARVNGVIKYGELSVAIGAHIVGELQAISAAAPNAASPSNPPPLSRPLLKFPPLSSLPESADIPPLKSVKP